MNPSPYTNLFDEAVLPPTIGPLERQHQLDPTNESTWPTHYRIRGKVVFTFDVMRVEEGTSEDGAVFENEYGEEVYWDTRFDITIENHYGPEAAPSPRIGRSDWWEEELFDYVDGPTMTGDPDLEALQCWEANCVRYPDFHIQPLWLEPIKPIDPE